MLVATWCYYKLDKTHHTLKPSKVVESCTTRSVLHVAKTFQAFEHTWPSPVNSEEVCLLQFVRLHIFTLLAGCCRHNGLSGNDSWYVLNVTTL